MEEEVESTNVVGGIDIQTFLGIIGVLMLLGSFFYLASLYKTESDRLKEINKDLSNCRYESKMYKQHTEQCLGLLDNCMDLYQGMSYKLNGSGVTESTTIVRYITNSDVPEFVSTARKVADSEEYEMDTTNCEWFTRETVQELESLGYDARRVLVVVDCESNRFQMDSCLKYEGRHAIVRVDNIFIEATTGHVIMPEDYGIYGIDWRSKR